jgi:hypothetical protein
MAIEAAYIEEAPSGRHSRSLRPDVGHRDTAAALRPVLIGEVVPGTRAGRNLPRPSVSGSPWVP